MENYKNFEALLSALGFEKDGLIYKKFFPNFNVELCADFASKELYYPEAIKGRERNNNFNAPENFVVFECVNRLLEKGYRPEDIELEKEWHLGHDAKSGRADICVKGKDSSMLFIIECKTWGTEFDKALKDTKKDGAQLFSYWQQERACKWLVLYSSDFDDGEVKYKAPTINCSDDENFKRLAQNDETIKLYEKANTVLELYDVWQETYERKIHDDLIFDADAAAYNVEVKPLRKKNLQPIEQDNKIVNQFEEILRHNNVSDKENAFNRLTALFICKLVDETNKSEDDEVAFQYRQGSDTYESLQDRLQELHSRGMDKFMREKIFYVGTDYAEKLFSTYKGSNRKNAIKDLQETIRKLKFYSNNDFAFKDVHNEELFIQNGKILVEMVQLFEKYRIIYKSRHQLLGDLFEQLLNKGFKQNEGQFFTPIPVTRFIWDCLPVARIAKAEYPKIIDYACGAGHFLTEAIEAINYFQPCNDNSWARDHIFGIEKDYRLARVAKISLFMNGAGDGNIIFGDGLENSPDKGIENENFDILVSNPPYSVKDFSQYLQLKNNKFNLLDKIRPNSSEIETLFVERIGQLLKPGGIAAVILPSSILSNDSASYTGARMEILKKFYIRAIVAFGSKTFGATGTNTVVMFLERFKEPPIISKLYLDSVEAIFNGEDSTAWQDKEILDAYTAQIELNEEIYKKFLNKGYSIEELNSVEYFKMYAAAFANSTEALKIMNSKKTPDERTAVYFEKFYSYAFAIEKEKLLYFSLVYHQKTLIITAPADNKEQKEFLGYDWSDKKGNEGIKILKPGGKLYNNDDRAADDTLAAAVRKTFEGVTPILSEEQAAYASIVNTRDMLDFSRVSFNKAMKLTAEQKFEFKTKFAMVNLETLAEVSKGKAITRAETVSGDYKVVAGGVDYAYKHNEYNREANVITVSASGANAGYVNFWSERIFASDCSTIRGKTLIATKWLYYYLKSIQEQIYKVLQKGAAQPHVYPEDLKLIPVPNVDEKLQAKIVAECEAVDNEYNATRMNIESYRKKIEEIFNELGVKQNEVTLFDVATLFRGVTYDKKEEQLKPTSKIVLTADNITLDGRFEIAKQVYIDDAKEFSDDSRLKAKDIFICMSSGSKKHVGKVAYIAYDTNFYAGGFMGIIRTKDGLCVSKYLYYVLNSSAMRKKISESSTGSNINNLSSSIGTLKINLPPLDVQQKIVDECEAIEAKIAEAEKKLDALKGKTSEILERYLK